MNLSRFAGIPGFREFLLCPGVINTKSKKLTELSIFNLPEYQCEGARNRRGTLSANQKSTFYRIAHHWIKLPPRTDFKLESNLLPSKFPYEHQITAPQTTLFYGITE